MPMRKIVLLGPTRHDGLEIDHIEPLPERWLMPIPSSPALMRNIHAEVELSPASYAIKCEYYQRQELNDVGHMVYKYQGIVDA